MTGTLHGVPPVHPWDRPRVAAATVGAAGIGSGAVRALAMPSAGRRTRR